jgi:hypothetical protein
MFELITEVPEPILEYYRVDTRTEPTGEMISEPYTYLGEEGNELTDVRMVPEMVDNDYVVMVPRPQMVSWEKVNQIIAKHKGKKDALVDTFIGMAIVTDGWAFHDSYIDWLKDCESVDEYNVTEQLDEEGEVIAFESREYPSEPVYTPVELNQWKISNYAVLRKAAYGSTLEQLELQVDGLWEAHITEVKVRYSK